MSLCLSDLLILQMMKVRLQQPSGRELAPFNPTHPPAAITQVMLLANPLKVEVFFSPMAFACFFFFGVTAEFSFNFMV